MADTAESITEGCHVIVVRDKTQRLVQVQEKGNNFYIDKLRINLNSAIGQPFGAKFLIQRGDLQRILPSSSESKDASLVIAGVDTPVCASADGISSEKDNRNIVDDGKSQALTREDIVELKQSGLKPEQIIERLIASSSTFQEKTKFAQEKYIAKKARKHSEEVYLLRPNPRLLCEYFYRKDTEKICGLRPDSLSYILSMANIQYQSKCLLVEQCSGVVAAAILNRLDPSGSLVHLVNKGNSSNYQSVPAVRAMNFTQQKLSALYPIGFDEFFQHFHDDASIVQEPLQSDRRYAASTFAKPPVASEEEEETRRRRQEEKRRKFAETVRLLSDKQFDALVIAVSTLPLQALTACLIRFLSPSRPFVLYSACVEPLLAVFQHLKESPCVVNVMLSDTFMRRYQVLPGRTHPEMMDFVANGYCVTGLTVCCDSD